MPYSRICRGITLLVVGAPLCACTPGDPEQSAGAAVPATSEATAALTNHDSAGLAPDTAAWTVGITAKPGDKTATLLEVRTARHRGFERIVYVFGPEGLPGYKLEYVDRPVRQCGSGDVVKLPGDAWLSMQLEPARAHTEEGRATVVERDRAVNYENIKRLKLICDFEGIVEWVAALASPNRYRTLELRDPPRLVVDVLR